MTPPFGVSSLWLLAPLLESTATAMHRERVIQIQLARGCRAEGPDNLSLELRMVLLKDPTRSQMTPEHSKLPIAEGCARMAWRAG